MSTMHETAPERRHLPVQLTVEVWASLAILAMWVAVSITAIWGPNFVSTSNDGNSTTIPSGVFVAGFAALGTWAVAKHALRHREP